MAPNRDDILEFLRSAKHRFAEEYGVHRIGLFGSLARGDQSSDSDIDIVVELDSPTFDQYMELKFELEDHFGISVDLVLLDSLKRGMRPKVEQEAIFA